MKKIFYKDGKITVDEVLSIRKSEIDKFVEEINKINKKLEIAVSALKEYATRPTHDWINSQMVAKKALNDIDEVEK